MAPQTQKLKAFSKASHLPNELIDAIVEQCDSAALSKDVVNLMLVSKHWSKNIMKKTYRKVQFKSVRQRELFFQGLVSDSQSSPSKASPSSSTRAYPSRSPTKSSPTRLTYTSSTSRSPRRTSSAHIEAPPVVLRRRGLRSNKQPFRIQMIHSLHFGLGPHVQSPHSTVHSVRSVFATTPKFDSPARSLPPIRRSSDQDENELSPLSAASSIMSPSLRMGRFNLASPTLGTPSPKIGSFSHNLTFSNPRMGRSNLASNDVSSPAQPSSSHLPPIKTNITKQVSSARSAPPRLAMTAITIPAPISTVLYGQWEDRFITPLLPLIGSYIPHLLQLSISGCHINDWDFSTMLSQLPLLERLDVSFSTIKNAGLEGISRYCRHELTWLDVSGIFRFGRNRSGTIAAIVQHCRALKLIVMRDCPEIDHEEHLQEFRELSEGRVSFITELE